MSAKPASHGLLEGVPPGQAVAEQPWTTATVVSECLGDWTLRNTSLGWPSGAGFPIGVLSSVEVFQMSLFHTLEHAMDVF
jgi:hypothetical protein